MKLSKNHLLVAGCLMCSLVHLALAQSTQTNPPPLPDPHPFSQAKDEPQQTVLELSRQKWEWMADRDIASLDALFHAQAMFVHMGGNMTKEQELQVIQTGGIHYKHAEVYETSVRFIGDTAIVLSRIQLDAVVGGHEVSNPFTVTEVYVKQNPSWKLASLSFTRLLR